MTELKPLPCPFCNGINIIHCAHHMYCHACGADGPDADSAHESEALEAWNRRAQPAQAVPLLTEDELQAIEDNHLEGGSLWDVYRAIEQAVRAKMGAGVGWQPIETAPRGQRVLVWIADKEVDEPIAFAKVWFYADGTPGGGAEGFSGKWNLTHWHPFPPPPGIVGKEDNNDQ